MSLSTSEVKLIVQEVLQQSGQQGAEQLAQQVEQSISEAIQKVQGSQQERSQFSENKAEEVGMGEIMRSSNVYDFQVQNYNKKLVQATELKEKELAIAEREAKLRHQVNLDAIAISEREHAALVTKLADLLTIDFRTAAYHPISPNDQDNSTK